MKDQARGFVIAAFVLTLGLPILYVGTEGVWYLATGEIHFREEHAYRYVYGPLDWTGDRYPAIYEVREAAANLWLVGQRSRKVHVHPRWLPGPWDYPRDDVEYFPPDNEFKLSRAAAAMQQRQRLDTPNRIRID